MSKRTGAKTLPSTAPSLTLTPREERDQADINAGIDRCRVQRAVLDMPRVCPGILGIALEFVDTLRIAGSRHPVSDFHRIVLDWRDDTLLAGGAGPHPRDELQRYVDERIAQIERACCQQRGEEPVKSRQRKPRRSAPRSKKATYRRRPKPSK